MYVNLLPDAVNMAKVYLRPEVHVQLLIVMVPLAPAARVPSVPMLPPYVGVFKTSSIVTYDIVKAFAPVFVTAELLDGKVKLMIFDSSVFMRAKVRGGKRYSYNK